MPAPRWGWDRNSQRYRDLATGRYMPRQQVLDYVGALIDGRKVVTDRLAQFVATGSINPKDFGETLKGELKRQYVNEYMLGRGGRHQMTQRDWGSIGGMLKEQYKYIPGFVDDLTNKELTEEYIAARAGMYVNSSREAFERAHNRNAEDLGMTEEKWVLGETEHCGDCIAFEAQGWQPMGTFPPPGSGATACLTNCGCLLLHRNPETGAQY